jgi:hypothetical protein
MFPSVAVNPGTDYQRDLLRLTQVALFGRRPPERAPARILDAQFETRAQNNFDL